MNFLKETEKILCIWNDFQIFKAMLWYRKNKKKNNGLVRKIDRDKLNEFIKKIPFKLTDDQLNAIDEIVNDLEAPNRMNRLLQGDVGSGKTVVAFTGMFANYLCGYQSALMAPTEILATQHYNNLVEFLKDTDVNIALLTGSTPKKEKN